MNVDPRLREELPRIIDAVAIHSPSAFSFAGNRSGGIAMPLTGLQLSPEMPPLMGELTAQLYQHCFSNRFTGQIARSDAPGPESNAEWMETLSRANQSRERWEEAWQVVHGMPNGQVLAKRGSTMRILAPGEFVNLSGSGIVLVPGTPLRIYVPRESLSMQPGYYFVFGETLPDSSDEFSVVRFYWNVPAEGVVELLQFVSGELNKWKVPFRFKTGTSYVMLARSDSAVLYTPRRYAQFVFELVSEIHQRVQPLLREDVPLFTLRLAPGLAFAEDPGTQESFGISRCRMLAHGLWLAHQGRAQHPDERRAIVEQHFQSQGISLERPWLNPGSANEFTFTALDREVA
jgi:hypothetical protein